MDRAKLYEIFVLEKKVEQQEDNTLRDVKVVPLFSTIWLSISYKLFKDIKILDLLEMLSKPQ